VSDVVAGEELPGDIRRNLDLWAGCVAGALTEAEYRTLLRAAGFEEIGLEPTRVYAQDDARILLMSAFIRARKPMAEAL
jgi:hypothetical protein